MVFRKNPRWNTIFLLLSGKMIFFLPENMILPVRQKMKDVFLKKIHGSVIFSSNVLKRWSFQKGLRWDMIFLVLSGKMVLFPQKHDIFFPRKKVRDSLFQEIHGNMLLPVYTYGCYTRVAMSSCQKMSRMVLSRKNTTKSN